MFCACVCLIGARLLPIQFGPTHFSCVVLCCVVVGVSVSVCSVLVCVLLCVCCFLWSCVVCCFVVVVVARVGGVVIGLDHLVFPAPTVAICYFGQLRPKTTWANAT